MADRNALVAQLQFSNPSERADLLDPAQTQDDLIAMLAVIVASGVEPLITSVRTDHGDDSQLGPHGHARGYAVDLWVPASQANGFINDLLYRNHYCTKIGLGGSFKGRWRPDTYNGTLVFEDNSTEHIHIQTA